MIDRVESDGPIDVLVNNATVEAVGAFTDLDEHARESMIYLNATVTAELCRQAIPRMLSRGEGRIVNISSLAGIVTTPHLAAYSATKACVTQLSAGLSLELRGTPVACTKVEIGETRGTGQSDNVREDPVVAAIFERLYRLHLSRQLSPEEVTHAVLRAVRYGLPSVQLPRRVAPAARLADALRMSTSYATRGATTTDPTTELTAPR